MKRRSIFLNVSSAGFGFLCSLHAPIIALIIYSFNKSKLVTVWGGWSLKWYAELMQNEQIINAALLSLENRLYQRHRWPWCWAPWPALCSAASGRSAAR